MQHSYVHITTYVCQHGSLHVDIIMLYVNIIMLYVDINMPHVNTFMLNVEMIYLAFRGYKYATIFHILIYQNMRGQF